MAWTEVKSSGVGIRNVQVLVLNSSDYPNATGTTVYEGLTVEGAKTIGLTDPEPRQVVHFGDDKVFAIDVLPPTDVLKGTMTMSKQDAVLDAAIQGVNSVTIGEGKFYPLATDKRGNENLVCVLTYRQAINSEDDSTTLGTRVWQFKLFPKCYVIPQESGFTEAPEERTYSINPQFCTKYPWGVAVSNTTEGATRVQGFRGVCQGKPKIVAWKTNAVTTSFSFPSDGTAYTTSKIAAFFNGVTTTPTTVGVTSIAFTTAPTTDGYLVAFYETL